MNVRSRRNNLQKTLKDYLVPIIAIFLIIVLIYSMFSGNDTTNNGSENTLENTLGANIEFATDDSEVYIEYSGGDKKLIEDNTILYKGEKVDVKEGSLSINFPGLASVALDTMGSLEYRENGDLYLDSSNLWLEAKTPMTIAMRYGSVDLSEGAVVSLNQNEVESTIYNLSGIVEVSNLAGQKTVLGKGQKISILVADASNDEVDLSTIKEELDDYFKASDWFVKNSGDFYLNSSDNLETSSGGLVDNKLQVDLSSLLSFNNLSDESYASSDNIDIAGKYNSDRIGKILLQNQEATLDPLNKNFSFKSVALDNSSNDLVFKIYDKTDNIISKLVYTIYTNSKAKDNSSSGFTVTNFKLDASKFLFTSPSSTGTYSTFEDRVTIKGSVPAGVVSKVTVNGYQLGSFNGKTWRYHAWVSYGNLKDGTNSYEVKYFDVNGKMIYKNYYTIIRKTNAPKAKYSEEAKVSE